MIESAVMMTGGSRNAGGTEDGEVLDELLGDGRLVLVEQVWQLEAICP